MVDHKEQVYGVNTGRSYRFRKVKQTERCGGDRLDFLYYLPSQNASPGEGENVFSDFLWNLLLMTVVRL
jgi:hypothetical protein